MKIRPLNSISLILAMLTVLSVSSYAFASENGTGANSMNQTPDLKFGLSSGFSGNTTGENFTDVKAFILNSISKRITELQSLYTDVSKASNESDLKEVLLSHRQANQYIGPERLGMRHGRMNIGSCGANGFYLNQVENVTDENFTAVKIEMLSSLQNSIVILKDKQTRLVEVEQNNRTQELNETLNERINKLQNLSTEVSKASTASELKEVVFKYMQTQAVDLIDREIKYLQAKVSESKNESNGNNTSNGNKSIEQINSRIAELTTLKENINGAKSLDDLKKIISSSRGISGPKENMMHHKGYGRYGCHVDRYSRIQSSNFNNSANNTTYNGTV